MSYKKWRYNRYRQRSGGGDLAAVLCAVLVTFIVADALLNGTDAALNSMAYAVLRFFRSLLAVLRPYVLGILILVLLFCLGTMTHIVKNAQKLYVNAKGYAFRERGEWGEFEHRLIAKRHLGRDLLPFEQVHHINRNRMDNRPHNLCVLTADNHKAFHLWLTTEKKKRKRYPLLAEQREVLVTRYQGEILAKLYKPERTKS